MRIFNYKRLYLPALSIVTAVILMLVLISISTYRNLDRDKRKAMASLYREGMGMIRSLEAGTRVGVITADGKDSVGILIRESAKNENIAHIYLVDSKGNIAHHSDPSQIGKRAPWQVQFSRPDQVFKRITERPQDPRVFELVKKFSSNIHDEAAYRQNVIPPKSGAVFHKHPQGILILGLKMTEIDEAHKADLHHAIIMAAIMVALGSGALFFIFVIQNYYLVDKTLKETQDYTRQVIAHMANGLISINSAGEVASYNHLALELLGLDEKYVQGMALQKIMDFDASGISETLTGCRPVLDREIRYRLNTGEEIPLSLSITPIIVDKDQCSGAVILLRDLREIKRLQDKVRRSEKLAAIGKLAAGVAHEIRNPLSSIRGFAQFLRHALKDKPEESEYAAVMVREVDRINRVVTDLLTYARPLSVERIEVDLQDLVAHTVKLVTADAQSKEVRVHQKMRGNLKKLWLDANQITQALLNLLLNALQAVPSGGNIEIGADLVKYGEHLHVWVEDDGAGIPLEHRDKVLDPFFTTRKKGTGLGLAIVHKIMENHHGDIYIESPAPGNSKGTRISLLFPLSINKG
ncbi:MAG: PAS domain S-box protein [Deltaproteobacteria bacterium]|nr:PAS domain S-box protein [Deltaproteobacteria bacterium]